MKKNNNETIELNKKDFSFLCPMQIGDMKSIDGGYFCGECNKKVHDVSGMSKEKYHDLVSKTENICVTFKKVATVSLALSMAASATDNNSSNMMKGEILYTPTQIQSSETDSNGSENMLEEVFTGDIMPVEPPEEIAEENSTSSTDSNITKLEGISCRTTGKVAVRVATEPKKTTDK